MFLAFNPDAYSKACRLGDLATVKKYHQGSSDAALKWRDVNNWTGLMVAARSTAPDTYKVVEYLAGLPEYPFNHQAASLTPSHKHSVTALNCAVECNHGGKVKLLASKPIEIVCNMRGEVPGLTNTSKEIQKIINKKLQYPGHLVYEMKTNDQSTNKTKAEEKSANIHHAYLSPMGLFTDAGAFLRCCETGHLDLVKQMLRSLNREEARTYFNQHTPQGENALMLAAKSTAQGTEEIVEYLANFPGYPIQEWRQKNPKEEPKTALNDAIESGNVRKVQSLMKRGARVAAEVIGKDAQGQWQHKINGIERAPAEIQVLMKKYTYFHPFHSATLQADGSVLPDVNSNSNGPEGNLTKEENDFVDKLIKQYPNKRSDILIDGIVCSSRERQEHLIFVAKMRRDMGSDDLD